VTARRRDLRDTETRTGSPISRSKFGGCTVAVLSMSAQELTTALRTARPGAREKLPADERVCIGEDVLPGFSR
jgi:hypothetical protein